MSRTFGSPTPLPDFDDPTENPQLIRPFSFSQTPEPRLWASPEPKTPPRREKMMFDDVSDEFARQGSSYRKEWAEDDESESGRYGTQSQPDEPTVGWFVDPEERGRIRAKPRRSPPRRPYFPIDMLGPNVGPPPDSHLARGFRDYYIQPQTVPYALPPDLDFYCSPCEDDEDNDDHTEVLESVSQPSTSQRERGRGRTSDGDGDGERGRGRARGRGRPRGRPRGSRGRGRGNRSPATPNHARAGSLSAKEAVVGRSPVASPRKRTSSSAAPANASGAGASNASAVSVALRRSPRKSRS